MEVGSGRQQGWPATIPSPEQAGHIEGLEGTRRKLAIAEQREVQVLRALIKQSVDEGGHGAVARIAEQVGVAPQWIGRLLRWSTGPGVPKTELPPQSVSLAKFRALGDAAGVPMMDALMQVLEPDVPKPQAGEDWLEWAKRVSAPSDWTRSDELQLMILYRQLPADARRGVLWQLRGMLERRPVAGFSACKVCGGRILRADAKRLAGVCLECSVPAGVLDTGPPGSGRPGPQQVDPGPDEDLASKNAQRIVKQQDAERARLLGTSSRPTSRSKRGGDTSGNRN